MPAINANLNMLSAAANYSAGDWLTVGAQGSLDFAAGAAFKRGIDLQLSAEALVKLDGSIQKFLAIDAQAFASASAGVRAQVQTPIDLFGEAGLAIRLQAQAQAAAGVELGIGLVVGDFLALVDADPRLRGAPARLVRVLLEEAKIGGGVQAKAAVAAMIYANVSATGRLIASGRDKPGFTVAVEYGVGWGAGAGIKGFVNFGLDDPRNLVRRSIDVAVGSTLEALAVGVDDRRLVSLLGELDVPLRIALRTCFEIGVELAANRGAFGAGAGATLALRAVQVALEEAQRAILERAVRWAGEALRGALGTTAVSGRQWTAARAARGALAAHLAAIPLEPFDPTPDNRLYWSRTIDLATAAFVALGGFKTADDPGVGPLAALYAATQLLFAGIERISSASARASVIGVPPAVATASFTGSVTQPAALLRTHINTTIGSRATAAITQESLVTFLVEGKIFDEVSAAFPEIDVIVETIVGSAPGAVGGGISTIFSNIGAFVPASGGGVDPHASLAAILLGLRTYIDTRLRNDLMPALEPIFAELGPEVRTYLDEVLLGSLDFAVNEVLTQLLDWSNGSAAGQTALREACSAILMRLFGRSLVVTADAILDRTLDGLSDAFRDVAAHVGDRGGIADFLTGKVPTLSRADIEELVSEHFLVMADAALPLDPDQRAHIRGLLYAMMDFGAAAPGSPLSEQLLTDTGAKNIVAGTQVALAFGRILAERIASFIGAWLVRIGRKAIEEFGEVIDAIVAQVKEWIADLEKLVGDLGRQLAALLDEIDDLVRAVDDRFDEALGSLSAMVRLLTARGDGRARLKAKLAEEAEDIAHGVMASLPGFDLVPGWAIRQVDNALKAAIEAPLIDVLLDPVLDALRGPALAAADFLDDLREIEPGDDLAEAVLDLFLDRIEDALTDMFGGRSPRLVLAVRFTARARLQTPLGTVNVEFDVDFDLGSVRIPLGAVIDAARAAARSLDAVGSAAEDTATALAAALRAQIALEAAQAEHVVITAQKAEADALISQTRPGAMDAVIVSPAPASVVEGGLTVDLHLLGVPGSYLGLRDGEIQRVHVWLNREELPIGAFEQRVLGDSGRGSVERAGAPAAIDDAFAARPTGPMRRAPATIAAHARSTAASRTIIAGMQPSRGFDGLVRGRADIARIGRAVRPLERVALDKAAPAGIGLRLRIPPDRLIESINTLMVAVVDGRDRHRIVRSVSFVALRPDARPKPGRARPPKAVPAPGDIVYAVDKLPVAVRDRLVVALGRPFSAARATTPATGLKPASRRDAFLGPPTAERKKRAKAERLRVTKALQPARAPWKAFGDALAAGQLRAKIPAPVAVTPSRPAPAPTPSVPPPPPPITAPIAAPPAPSNPVPATLAVPTRPIIGAIRVRPIRPIFPGRPRR